MLLFFASMIIRLYQVSGSSNYDDAMTKQVPGVSWANFVGRHIPSTPYEINQKKATNINLLQNFAITSLCPTFILRLTQKVFIEQKIVPLLLLDISDSLEIISNKKFNKT